MGGAKAPTNSNPTGPASILPIRKFSGSFRVPDLKNPKLGYETGVHIGDGNLLQTPAHTYRYVISGNRINEQEYYRDVLHPLLEELYGVDATIAQRLNSIQLVTYSRDLVHFKNEVIGLPIGPKSQLVSFPSFVFGASNEWVAQMLSGLYDTDGCVKVRSTVSNRYPRISFAQKTKSIVEQVKTLLSTRFSIGSTMYENRYYDPRSGLTHSRSFLDINGFENFRSFMRQIGTRNPHISSRIAALGLL